MPQATDIACDVLLLKAKPAYVAAIANPPSVHADLIAWHKPFHNGKKGTVAILASCVLVPKHME